jgi:hypothetical protein
MDPWPNPDEDLGEQEVAPRDNGEVINFQHEGDPAMELTLGWEVEDPDDVGDPEDRGRSG